MSDKTPQDSTNLLFASNAFLLLKKKKINDALQLCEAGVREYPFYVPGHFVLGICYDKLGQMKEAKNEFERVLTFDPSHKTAMRRLSEIYSESGLEQLSNDLLIKEAIYSPMNSEIIHILKQKGLYENLVPVIEEESAELAEASTEKETEVKTELHEMDTTAEEQADVEENESEGFSNIDPLATDEKKDDDDDVDFENEEESIFEGEPREGYGLAEKNYLNSDDQDTDYDEWMEVENLLEADNFTEPEDDNKGSLLNISPPSEVLKNDTELLLEELRNAEAEADMESSISDEYEHVKSEMDSDNVREENSTAESPEPSEVTEQQTEEDEDSYVNDVVAEDEIEETSTDSMDQDEQKEIATDQELDPAEIEDEVTIKDLMENPSLVTPTFGEILIAQHKFNEARHVFLELNKKDPENPRFIKKINFLNKFLQAENN